MRLLYTLFYFFALIFFLPVHFFKRPKELRPRWLREKIGLLKSGRNYSNAIWIHAVSVGETLGARRIVSYLNSRFPESLILFSTMTDTGQEIARRELMKENPEGILIFYMPFDLGFIIKNILNRFKVFLFITMETEIWPNTFEECKRLNIPVIIVNARLSAKSARGYRKINFFMKQVLDAVNAFCCSSNIDADRFHSLGVERSRIHVTGNLKFDMPPPARPELNLKNSGKVIIIAGSTHQGEEAIMLQSLKELLLSGRVFLILAPRHPQRFNDVAGFVKAEGINFIRRTELSGNEIDADSYQLLLLDTIGELSSMYYFADIVLMGGSFVPVGGHNLLEPAYWSKPVICGRYMDNFPLAEEFFREGAALKTEPETLLKDVMELCNNPQKRLEIGKKAGIIYERNRGAFEKTLKIIEEIIDDKRPFN
ncbi:MAG: 3-deoxy-D-manno-octulosonic acid transferase [Thermodesulfovibrionales bacterium]|nr:3-deoxy-D-manno-octulosonic acid transferase [Thermodesulfovibrionales bacterium]